MTYVILWLFFGLIGAMISKSKGNDGCGGFLLGILLGPIGLLIAFFTPDNDVAKREKTGHTKKCPFCAEYVKRDAIICKHCGSQLSKDNDYDISDFQK